MEIKSYTIKELKQTLSSNTFWTGNEVPISKHKIISHTYNPRADENDIVLITASKNDNIIGYIGILPDKFFIDGHEQKFGWLTAWWVEPDERKSRVGVSLLLKALQAFDNNIGTSDFTDHAKAVYDSSGLFISLKELTEYKVFIRFITNEVLTNKFKALKPLKIIFKVCDRLLNLFVDFRLYLIRNAYSKKRQLKYEYISEIDNQTQEFIKSYRKNELIAREKVELDWLTKYPWIINAPINDKIAEKYKFLSVAKSFYYLKIKIFNDNSDMTGFIILRKRDKELTIPYFYFKPENIQDIIKVIIHHIGLLKVDVFFTKNEELQSHLKDINFPYIYIKKNKKYTYLTKKFSSIDFSKYHLQDGDADISFT
ncbi:MAG: hypothetical protein A2220_06135 [Ignavibacteria bacterium RIFOXYA2_FULL_35_10]|nr:MAG: hypothetical protein A2220_06135 [Ignavibacteria bacterium RIFOXYA2_FULL_35_10]